MVGKTCKKQVYRLNAKKLYISISFDDCKLEDKDNQYYINMSVRYDHRFLRNISSG